MKSPAQPQSNILKLEMKSGDKTSRAIVALANGASSGYNAEEDIYKLFSPLNVPEIYTIVDQKAIEINVADGSEPTHIIPIGFKLDGAALVELSLPEIENASEDLDIYIIDRKQDKKYNMKETSSISFIKTADENLDGRFQLSVGSPNSLENIDNSDIKVDTTGEFITVSSSDKITGLSLFDLSGRVQYQLENSGKYLEKISNHDLQGVFVLKVKTEGKTESYKIIL
jgi:hypothetical protein